VVQERKGILFPAFLLSFQIFSSFSSMKLCLKRKDIKEAMAFLTHCNLLKIEDILPFFPDFVLIDSFKEEVCICLFVSLLVIILFLLLFVAAYMYQFSSF
jgi:hypothetical protein